MQETITILTDDLDGSRMKGEEGHTGVLFALQGHEYEIDLSEFNYGKLQEALAPFIRAGRRTRKEIHANPADLAERRAKGRKPQTPIDRLQARQIRSWAAAQPEFGDLKRNGRVPQRVVDAYNLAHRVPVSARRQAG